MSGYKSYDSFAHVNDISVFDFLMEKINALKNDISFAWSNADSYFEDGLAALQSYLDPMHEKYDYYDDLVCRLEQELEDLYERKQECEYRMEDMECGYDGGYDDGYGGYDDGYGEYDKGCGEYDEYGGYDECEDECSAIEAQIEVVSEKLRKAKEKRTNIYDNINALNALIDFVRNGMDQYYYFEKEELNQYFEQELSDAYDDLSSDKALLERYIDKKFDFNL